MADHVDAHKKCLLLADRGVRVQAVELAMNQEKVRVRTSGHQAAVLTFATGVPPLTRVVWSTDALGHGATNGRTAQQCSGQSRGQHLAAHALGPGEQISMWHAVAGQCPLDDPMGAFLVLDIKDRHARESP